MSKHTSSEPVLTLDGVQLQLSSDAGPVSILRGIDLTVAAGDTVGVVGPSGSGKTSLLMVIAGLEKTTAGRITAAGTEISGLDEDSLARFRRDHIGIVFQNFHLVPTMSALSKRWPSWSSSITPAWSNGAIRNTAWPFRTSR